MTEVGTCVGIDVAKANIDIAVRPGERVWQASYDAAGIEELVSQLGDLKPTTVLLEATSGLEVPLAAALAAAALPVAVVNPRSGDVHPSLSKLPLMFSHFKPGRSTSKFSGMYPPRL